MKYPNRERLEMLRKKYPVGTKLRLVHMDDVQAPPKGTIGEVTCVDDIGSVHVKWETGSSLAVIPEIDKVQKL